MEANARLLVLGDPQGLMVNTYEGAVIALVLCEKLQR